MFYFLVHQLLAIEVVRMAQIEYYRSYHYSEIEVRE